MVSRAVIAFVMFSGFLISNPFYFMEDILYGDNGLKKDFGVYVIEEGPVPTLYGSRADHWNYRIKTLFNQKIENKEWPNSIRNHITEYTFDGQPSILMIKGKDLIPFKRKIKQLKRKDPYFKEFDFLYYDAVKFADYNDKSFKDHNLICIVKAEPILNRDDIHRVYLRREEYNYAEVVIELNDLGKTKWSDFTAKNRGRFTPISLDNEIISMPSINVKITAGLISIRIPNPNQAEGLIEQLK